MRLGVFGGTFDPIHLGHMTVAEDARRLLDLDEVRFIPAGSPWLKTGQRITDARHRMAMVRRAVAAVSYFRTSDIEVKRPGPTYTVDTLEQLKKELGPDTEFFLILGLDSLRELARWRDPRRILEMCTVAAMPRPGSRHFEPSTMASIAPDASARIRIVDGASLLAVSGTEIRRRVSQGLPIDHMVPQPVVAYIRDHGLYSTRSGPDQRDDHGEGEEHS